MCSLGYCHAFLLSAAGVDGVELYAYAATPPNQPQRYIFTDYFNNYNFNKASIIRSLMMVIETKHVGAVLM